MAPRRKCRMGARAAEPISSSKRLGLLPMVLDRVRLAKLCEMLRSDNEQERATAAVRASTLLHAAGHSWTELVLGVSPARDAQSPFTPQDASYSVKGHDHRRRTRSRSGIDAADIIRRLQDVDKLTDWERQFIAILGHQLTATGLTASQWHVVEKIARRSRLWKPRR